MTEYEKKDVEMKRQMIVLIKTLISTMESISENLNDIRNELSPR